MYHGAVDWVILIAGVAGLGCVGYGLFSVVAGARRRRRPTDVIVAVAVAVAAVALLVAFGDRLVR